MMQSHLPLEALRGKSYGVEHILSPQTGLLSEILESTLHLQPEQTEFLLQLGSIYLNNERLLTSSPSPTVAKGDYLRVHQNPRRFPIELLRVQESILWENEDLVLIHKPSGLPVHPTVDNTQENVIALFEKALGQKFFVTHRLDVATQGLLVLAKNKSAQSLMNIKLMKNEVTKHYRAHVSALHPAFTLPLGEIVHYMEPSPRAPKKLSPVEHHGWQQCRLRILDRQVLNGSHHRVLIALITGRTHQIRAQLSALGFPIRGDHAYGSPEKWSSHEEIALQAYSIHFEWQGELISHCLPEIPPKA